MPRRSGDNRRGGELFGEEAGCRDTTKTIVVITVITTGAAAFT